ncbi:hypothetical protein EYC84_002032 [Monilinia fructicola]|uniref:Uncharacterized protein n=1 Tax=Monilinia fructicola TaxID=38448 RepID=A0A5M9JU10_MONFR|nr:hypothetical protein EYC84_002032 [Monilinia fructicola]
MADRDRRRERTTPETSPKETPPEEAPPKEDLSATIQDPDAPPGVPPHPDPGAQLPRRSLPRTEEGIFDFSGIGRRARPDDGQPAPVPAPRGAPLPLRAPSPPADDKFDMAPFRRADGSYDMRALLVVRRNWEMMRREEEERRKILGMEKSGKGSGEGEKGEKGEREGEGVKGEEGKREAGGDDDEDDLYGASPVKPIPPKSPPTQKGTEEEKKQQPDDEDDLYGASPMKPISPKLPPVDEDDLYGASPMKPISPKLPPVEEDDLYGASPMKPISPKLPPDEKEDTGNKKQGQEQRPEDKKSDIPLENPKSPKVSPEKKEDSLWDRIFGRAQKPSPTKSEKYRRLAAKNAKVPTNKEKFDYWMKHDLSSPRAFVADEQQWQNEMELLYAREKYIAELQQTKADARAMIMIHQCELQLQEAEGLEDKRQRSRSIQASLDLETSPTLKAKFNDQLRDLNSQIEVGEEKEKSILKPWANLSPDWSARLQKAADMTPSERARLIAERGLQAPARAPGQLKQSSAEKALRAKWAAEDSPLEDEVMEIDMISDESEQDLEWNLAMRRRQSVLLARHRELSKLWTKEAEQIRADREAAWLESKGEKRIPGSAPRPRVPSTGQSENLREGGGGSGGRGAGSSETRSEKQKQEKKDKEDEGKESARTEVEGSKKVSGTGAEDADELGRRRRRQTQGLLSVAGLRQMPELKPTAPLSRKKSTDAVSNSPGTPLPSQRKESTPEQPLSPFRATRPISPLQEGRKRVKFHVDSEVSEYLESLAKKRVQREMGQLGEEMVDLDKVRNLVDKVAKPAPLGSAEAAESVAAMRRRATRIREAKERLALAAQKEVDRLREEEEKKKKKEEKEKARGEGKSLFEEEEDKKNRKGEEEKPSFQEIMEQLERDRVARQNKERIRQKMELERRKKEEEEMAAEREKRRKEAERERREMESKDMEDWTSERLERLKLERERREKSGKQESSMDKDKRELKEKKEEDEEDAKKRDIERMQKKRQEEDDRDRREERDRRERDDRERREKYGKEEKELKEREEKEKIEKEKIEKEKIERRED